MTAMIKRIYALTPSTDNFPKDGKLEELYIPIVNKLKERLAQVNPDIIVYTSDMPQAFADACVNVFEDKDRQVALLQIAKK